MEINIFFNFLNAYVVIRLKALTCKYRTVMW